MKGKYRKRRIDRLKIGEVSSVDSPAQDSGDGVILKNERVTIMTLPDKTGHAHVLYLGDDYSETSYGSKDSNSGHSHPYAVTNGLVVIGEALEHTHEVNKEQVDMALFTQAVRENIERDLVHKNNDFIPEEIRKSFIKKLQDTNQEEGMAEAAVDFEKKLKDATDVVQKKLDDVTVELMLFKAMSDLNDMEKAHYASLDDKAKPEFIAKSHDERTVILEKIASADAVIYKSLSGEVFKKSDDARMVSIAKRADETEIKFQAELEKNQTAELTKRAETELEFMPGDVATRAAIIKAVDGIEDATVKKSAFESLKAKNDSLGKAFTTLGSNESASGQDGSPGAELDGLAKAHATKEGVTYIDAYSAVSNANPELYKRAINGSA